MKSLKVFFVVLGAVVVTALGIDAADTLSGSRSTLLGQLAGSGSSVCPAGMVEVPGGLTISCVDAYEAAPARECPVTQVRSVLDTAKNLESSNCGAASYDDAEPWTYINRDEAATLCLRSGKRLLDTKEWFTAALGTAVAGCNIYGKEKTVTGATESCVSAIGAHDMAGNVWEWTAGEVRAGAYAGQQLPATGYVTLADSAGLAASTSDTPTADYGADYFWNSALPVAAIMRGGFYGSDSDGGIYTTHLDVTPNQQGEAIGFRCGF